MRCFINLRERQNVEILVLFRERIVIFLGSVNYLFCRHSLLVATEHNRNTSHRTPPADIAARKRFLFRDTVVAGFRLPSRNSKPRFLRTRNRI